MRRVASFIGSFALSVFLVGSSPFQSCPVFFFFWLFFLQILLGHMIGGRAPTDKKTSLLRSVVSSLKSPPHSPNQNKSPLESKVWKFFFFKKELPFCPQEYIKINHSTHLLVSIYRNKTSSRPWRWLCLVEGPGWQGELQGCRAEI